MHTSTSNVSQTGQGASKQTFDPKGPQNKRIDVVSSLNVAFKVWEYLKALQAGTKQPGDRLRGYCNEYVPGFQSNGFKSMKIVDLWQAIIRSKQPCIYAEQLNFNSETRWNTDEYEILVGTGLVMECQTNANGVWGYNGDWAAYKEYVEPFKQIILLISGLLLTKTSPDYKLVVDADGTLNVQKYFPLLEERLLMLLLQAKVRAGGQDALLVLTGVGCGFYSGEFRGIVGEYLNYSLKRVLDRHKDGLLKGFGKLTVILDGFYECRWETAKFGDNIEYRVRSTNTKRDTDNGKTAPQLSRADEYEETPGEFANAVKIKIDAADSLSLPGNEGLNLQNSTDDGATCCATNMAEVLLPGEQGEFTYGSSKEEPPKFHPKGQPNVKWTPKLDEKQGELIPLNVETLHVFDLENGREIPFDQLEEAVQKYKPGPSQLDASLDMGFDSRDFALLKQVCMIRREKLPEYGYMTDEYKNIGGKDLSYVEITDILKDKIAPCKSREEKNKILYNMLNEDGTFEKISKENAIPAINIQDIASLEAAVKYMQVNKIYVLTEEQRAKTAEIALEVDETLKRVITADEEYKIVKEHMGDMPPVALLWLVRALSSPQGNGDKFLNLLYKYLAMNGYTSASHESYWQLAFKRNIPADQSTDAVQDKDIKDPPKTWADQDIKNVLLEEALAQKQRIGGNSQKLDVTETRAIEEQSAQLEAKLSKKALCVMTMIHAHKAYSLRYSPTTVQEKAEIAKVNKQKWDGLLTRIDDITKHTLWQTDGEERGKAYQPMLEKRKKIEEMKDKGDALDGISMKRIEEQIDKLKPVGWRTDEEVKAEEEKRKAEDAERLRKAEEERRKAEEERQRQLVAEEERLRQEQENRRTSLLNRIDDITRATLWQPDQAQRNAAYVNFIALRQQIQQADANVFTALRAQQWDAEIIVPVGWRTDVEVTSEEARRVAEEARRAAEEARRAEEAAKSKKMRENAGIGTLVFIGGFGVGFGISYLLYHTGALHFQSSTILGSVGDAAWLKPLATAEGLGIAVGAAVLAAVLFAVVQASRKETGTPHSHS